MAKHDRRAAAVVENARKKAAGKAPTFEEQGRLFGAVNAAMRDGLLAITTPAELVTEGRSVASEKVLKDLEPYLPEAYKRINALPKDRRANLGVSNELFAIALAECVELKRKKKLFDATETARKGHKARNAAQEKAAKSGGMATRDRFVTALRNGLTKDQKAELATKVGTAETAETLAVGLTNVADYAEGLLKSGDAAQLARLAAVNVDAAWVSRVRGAVQSVEAAGGPNEVKEAVDETSLNEQDGRVLFFLERIHKPLLEERRHDPTFKVPRLPNLEWMFDTAKRAKKPPKGTESTPGTGVGK